MMKECAAVMSRKGGEASDTHAMRNGLGFGTNLRSIVRWIVRKCKKTRRINRAVWKGTTQTWKQKQILTYFFDHNNSLKLRRHSKQHVPRLLFKGPCDCVKLRGCRSSIGKEMPKKPTAAQLGTIHMIGECVRTKTLVPFFKGITSGNNRYKFLNLIWNTHTHTHSHKSNNGASWYNNTYV